MLDLRALVRLAFASSVLTAVAVAGCSGGGGGGGGGGNGGDDPPVLTSISPDDGLVGTAVTLTGESFGDEQEAASFVLIGGAEAAVTSWGDTEIVVTVPDGAYPGARDVVVHTAEGVSAAQVFTVRLVSAVYVDANVDPDQVEGYTITSTGVTALAGSPWSFAGAGTSYGGYGETVALHPETRRLFSLSTLEIVSWAIDPVNGALTRLDGAGVTTDQLFGLTISRSGSRLIASDYGTGDFLALVVASDGELTHANGSPLTFPDGGTSHNALTADGRFAYSVDENGGTIYVVDLTATPIDELETHRFAAPSGIYDVEMAPDADRLYVAAYGTGAIVVLEPQADGSLIENGPLRTVLPTSPLSLCFAGDGDRLFVVDGDDNIYVFDVATNGALDEITGSPFTIPGGPPAMGITCSRDGTTLVVGGESDPEIHVMTVGSGGAPAPLGSSPFALATTTGGAPGFAFSY